MARLGLGLAASRAHLSAVGETYFEHMRFAVAVGALMVLAGGACLIHAVFPALCKDKASRAIRRLHAVIEDRRLADELVREGDAGGLLLLVLASGFTALLPWLVDAHPIPAVSLSLLSLGMPAAALGAGEARLRVPEPAEPAETSAPAATVTWLRRPRRRPEAPARTAPVPANRAQDVVIVGGGFSGTLLACHLARQPDARVTLIERRGSFARGLAYSTRSPSHMLNVRAAGMTALPDDPASFQNWLESRGLAGQDDFVPRRVYGDYLDDLLVEAMAASEGRLKLVSAEVVDVETSGRAHRVGFADGSSLRADRLVLALGNLPPSPPLDLPADLAPGLYRNDPWKGRLAEGLDSDSTVLLVGTGLTMIDVVLSLRDEGFEGSMIALSRRGLLPRAHVESQAPFACRDIAPAPLSHLLAKVRRRTEQSGWRVAIDQLRPQTTSLWQAASHAERARFLRHLRPWWDVHRHRVAPSAARRIVRLREAGRLQVDAGRLVALAASDGKAHVDWRPRGSDETRSVLVDRIIDCTGPNPDIGRSADPLLRNLLGKGLIRPDPLRLGVDVDESLRIVASNGAAVDGIFAVGPLTRGRFWEIGAVPDIRVQVAELAASLSQSAQAGVRG